MRGHTNTTWIGELALVVLTACGTGSDAVSTHSDSLTGINFFQGFEVDTSDWYADGSAVVNAVTEPSSSTSYNSGTTSVYADGIGAGSGSALGRIVSAVKTGTCVIDTTGAIGPSLLCYGPYTSFGLTPAYHVAKPFPPNGYTVELAVYLDATYASHHPDCSTAPCTPDSPGTVNPACVPGPDTDLACEGSRFTWTVGINDPTGNFHRDYVFQIGTAPDTYGSFPASACPSGYIINAQYNSFRSGGTPYQGFETKCLAASGWYTLREVFSNASDLLQVDWSILDSGGAVASCKDTTGASVPCTWSRAQSADPISSIGCPRYGWLADEEINDLAIDNTKFTTDGDCGQPQGTAKITPTNTTCQQFADGTATPLTQLSYVTKGSRIASVSPGVFFYYSEVTGAEDDTIAVTQARTEDPPSYIPIQKSQAILYSSTCAKLGSMTATEGVASGTLPSDGTFIIGVKYSASSLAGQTAPSPDPTSTYTFTTTLNGSSAVSKSIDLMKRK